MFIARNVPVLLLILLAVIVPAWSHDTPPAQEAQPAERRQARIPVRDFSLTDQSGRTFQFNQLKGKLVLLAFAYTTCPDVCPLITAAMRRVQSGLDAKERNSVYFLTVTTDPEIDSPNILAGYAKRYGVDHSNWAFLTGDPESLGAVWKNFGVKVVRKGRGLVDHTPLIALIDRQGAARLVYLGPSPDPKAILRDIRQFLDRG
ncbi:MAG: SCO family protein [Candidatus Binatia bacterium]